MAKPNGLDHQRVLKDALEEANNLQAANGALRRQVSEARNHQQQLLIVLAAVVKHCHQGEVLVPLQVVMDMPETGKVTHEALAEEDVLRVRYTDPEDLIVQPEIREEPPVRSKLIVLP